MVTIFSYPGTASMVHRISQLGLIATLFQLAAIPVWGQNSATQLAIEKLGGTYSSMKELSGPYLNSSTVHYIDFSRKPLTDEQLIGLSPRLSSLDGGIHLKLVSTQVTDKGFASLARLKKLQSVDITKARITETGVKQLRQVLPYVTVIDNTGPGAVYPPGAEAFRPWQPSPLDQPGCDDLIWSHDGQKLAVLSGTRTEIWDAATTKLIHALPGGATGAFSRDDKQFAAVTGNGTGNVKVRVWVLATQKEVFVVPCPWAPRGMAFGPTGKTLFLHGYSSGDEIGEYTLQGNAAKTHSAVLLGRSQNLAGFHVEQRLATLMDTQGKFLSAKVSGVPNQTRFTILSSNGQRLAWVKDPAYDGLADYLIRIVDTQTGKVVKEIAQPDKDLLLAGSFDADTRRLAFSGCSSTRNSVWVVDINSGKPLFTTSDLAGVTTQVALSPDGKRVAANFGYQSVKWWDVK